MSNDPNERLRATWERMVHLVRQEHRPRRVQFLKPFINEPDILIDQCYDANSKSPARMLHSLERLVGFADEQTSDGIRVFWLCVCAEALIKLRLPENSIHTSRKRVVEFFKLYTDSQDQELLKQKFKRSLADDKFFDPSGSDFDPKNTVDLTLEQIAHKIYCVRCEAVHGLLEEFHFGDGDWSYGNRIDVALPPAIDIERFDVTVSYEEFRALFMRAGIECIKQQLKAEAET